MNRGLAWGHGHGGSNANRAEFFQARAAIIEFLGRKWAKELDYRLTKELWAFHGNRIALRFQYEWPDDSGNWYRAYGWHCHLTWA